MVPESRDAGSTLGPQENLAALGPGEAIILMALIYFFVHISDLIDLILILCVPSMHYVNFSAHGCHISNIRMLQSCERVHGTQWGKSEVRDCFVSPPASACLPLGVSASQCLPIVIYNLKEKDILKSEVRD